MSNGNFDYKIPKGISNTSVQIPHMNSKKKNTFPVILLVVAFENRMLLKRELPISKMIQHYQGLSFLLVTFIGLADFFSKQGS
jgi:hypothetical protein